MSELIGPGEAARRLGVSTRTVQRWLRTGRLPGVRVGGRLKVDPDALATGGGSPATATAERRIRRLLVANRGELVVRIARTCRRLGVTCLALVAPDQRGAWWAGQADEAVPLEGSYLDATAIIAAARAAGADAVHPGYGFLAESADFAQAVLDAGLAWVGPPPAATRALGDKAAARRLAAHMGVPTLPGYEGHGQSDALLRREAARVGYPVLLKPSAGGGGKGMHVVRAAGDLAEALARARREARAAFGDERMVLERYLDRPRHVEVQLLLDAHGNGVHLGERDCSLQRRHQKVVEEAPAPGVAPALREALGEAALRLAREAGYVGAGTAEFLLDDAGGFYFLELNARLQVEHPVTETVTGLDLVEQQLAIAAGAPLGLSQADIALRGHAVEARLYAEDPWSGFLPATGRVLEVAWPASVGLRVDAGVGAGDEVGTRYDPLLAKLIAHGADRDAALDRLAAALDATRVLGVTTNRGFLRWLIDLPEVRAGDARTDTIEVRWHPDPAPAPEASWTAGAAALATALAEDGSRPGFRLNAPPRLRLRIGEEERSVAVPGEPAAEVSWTRAGEGTVVLDLEGRAVRVALAPPPTVESAVAHAAGAAGGSDTIRAPMPGVVLAVRVETGQSVTATQTLVVLEAMKMENNVPAPADARVARVLVKPGQPVQKGDPLVELA